MQSQSISNPKNFLINKEQLDKYLCIVCTQKSLNLLRCKTCKQNICNQCSIQIKTKLNKCPLRCTSGPLQLQRVNELIVNFICPFSSSCKQIIKSLKQFQQHDRFCKYISASLKQQKSHKWTFTCSKNHPLQVKIDVYQKLVERVKCCECSEINTSRVMCRVCDTYFCSFCRPLPLYLNECPMGHYFQQRQTKRMDYRCDCCELSPAILGVNICEDFFCNFVICEDCFKNWPSFDHKIQYIKNYYDYCDLVGNTQIQKKLNKNEFSNLKQQHKLQITGKKVLNICGRCQKQKDCFKICKKCDKYYCLDCKFFQTFQNYCGLGHQLKQILQSQDLSTLKNELLQKQFLQCLKCSKKVYLVFPLEQSIHIDQICQVAFCNTCLSNLIDRTNISTFPQYIYSKPYSDTLSKCKFDSTHSLSVLTFGSYKQKCKCCFCKEQNVIKFICFLCAQNQNYCSKCIQPPDLNRCYCGRLLVQKRNDPGFCCMICNKIGQTYFCYRCTYDICATCKQSKNNQIISQETKQVQLINEKNIT